MIQKEEKELLHLVIVVQVCLDRIEMANCAGLIKAKASENCSLMQQKQTQMTGGHNSSVIIQGVASRLVAIH